MHSATYSALPQGDEQVSVQHGVITTVAPLQARRGIYQANYSGEVYVLDANTNNPGAAGGALIDWQGQLLGVLGKELRSEVTGTWLSYALPVDSIASAVEDLLAGRVGSPSSDLLPPERPHSTDLLGFSLISDVLPRTPPYVDAVRRNSPAARAGMRTDDLVVFVGGTPIDSHRAVVKELERLDAHEPVTLSVLRQGELLEFSLTAPVSAETESAATAEETEEKTSLTTPSTTNE